MKALKIRSITKEIENTEKDSEAQPIALNHAKDLLKDSPKNNTVPKEFEPRALRDEIRR
jgi:hypothetical protein